MVGFSYLMQAPESSPTSQMPRLSFLLYLLPFNFSTSTSNGDGNGNGNGLRRAKRIERAPLAVPDPLIVTDKFPTAAL